MRKWFLWAAAAVAVISISLGITGWFLARRCEPFVREQAIRYLEDRFGTGVELHSLHVSVSWVSPLQLRTAELHVSGDGLRLMYPGASFPALLTVRKFQVASDLGALWNIPRRIHSVHLERLEINVPPKEMRAPAGALQATTSPAINVDTVRIDAGQLRIFPSDLSKPPRVFEVQSLTLKGMGPGRPMEYRAHLTNPTPPGIINISGQYGPWNKDDPGLTPISGGYTFDQADLSVFRSIAGILASTGRFQGVLRRIEVDGETRTPDFRLTGGNPLPLTTRFHSVVDGTTGDTLLQPVQAVLGSSSLVARGGVILPRGANARRIALDVAMSKGRIEDLLRLATKAPEPFLRGDIEVHSKMEIEPVREVFAQRLLLDGDFDIEESHFSGASVQGKIDELSRRAQGHPKDQTISDVLSAIHGGFTMRDGEIRFATLTFQVPGAAIHLKGVYGLYSEQIDLHGVARLQASASQTMTGWKRIALKPVDPFMRRAGAGTLLAIKVVGTRSQPEFALDHGEHQPESADRVATGPN